jgi:TonB-dependent receptor
VTKFQSILLGGVSIIAMGALTAQAFAQTATAANSADIETVVVTGIRASLQSAQSLKRNADIIQDSISAEDIGALPDRSVTEALQRVPGVTINYFAAIFDPDHFSAQGSNVIIRGLSDTQSLFNNRETFTANNGRIISFADVPSELLGGVDVYKSSSADMIEGGIGGTVNLRTRLPFDQEGQLAGLSLDGTWGDKASKWTFNGSGLYSNRWGTPAGEFGFLIDASRSQLYTQSDGTQIAAWGPGTDAAGAPGCPKVTCYIPLGADARMQFYDHTRTGVSAAGEWKSNDDSLLATVQFIRSESRENWNENSLDVAADVVAGGTPPSPPSATRLSPVPGTTWNYDSEGLFDGGMITQTQPNYGWWRSVDPTVPGFGVQAQAISRGVIETFLTNDMSGHLRWTPNDKLTVNFDAQHTWAQTDNLDASAWLATYVTPEIKQRGGSWDAIPDLQFLTPTNDAAEDPKAWFQDPGNYFWRSAMDHIEHSTGHENAVQADAEYMLDTSWLDSLKVGARYADRDQEVRYTTYNWGVLSEIWNGSTGPVWLGQNSYSADCTNFYAPPGNPGCGNNYITPNVVPGQRNPALIYGANLVKPFNYSGFQNGSVPNPFQGLFYSANPAANYYQYVQQMETINELWQPDNAKIPCRDHGFSGTGGGGWMSLGHTCDPVSPGSPFEPQDISPTQDKRTSLYAMVNFGSKQWISGNLGVRWIHMSNASSGFRAFPITLGTQLEGDTPEPVCTGMGTPPAICSLEQTDPALVDKMIQFCAPAIVGETDKQVPIWQCQGGTVPLSAHQGFDEVLPSLNAKVRIDDDMFLRLGISQSVSFADMGLLRDYQGITMASVPDENVQFVIGSGSTGNPYLRPTKAENYDLSYEWYFADVGSLTVATFYKTLHGVLTIGGEVHDFTNNGVTFPVFVAKPANAVSIGHIDGIELAYNQFMTFLPDPFNGLGLNLTYTFAESGGVEPLSLNSGALAPGSTPGSGCNGPCIPGLDYGKLPLDQISKHAVNIEGIYEKGPVSFRLAWNWRSRFLLTARDVIYPFAPMFNEPTSTLDGSFFYSITDHVKLGVQGQNLLNEVTRTSQVIDAGLDTAPRSWFTTDRRLSVVVRANY